MLYLTRDLAIIGNVKFPKIIAKNAIEDEEIVYNFEAKKTEYIVNSVILTNST